MKHTQNTLLAILLLLSFGSAGAVVAAVSPEVDKKSSVTALRDLKDWLAVPLLKRTDLSNALFATVPLTKSDASSATEALWRDHAAYIVATRAAEMDTKVIELDGMKMKFEWLRFTKARPTNGHSLFISMHGGGGAPPQVNESQWRNQIELGRGYSPAEGIYLAPRAPTDTWNLWHQGHIDKFFDRLIENLIVLENVNPNRVYILGYSAGGDGVYQLAPRMADRFAGAAMMAGHPNDAQPLGLRNLPFAIQVGANDGAFQRNTVAADWGRKLGELQKADSQGYVHFTELHEGKGHWMDMQDRKAIPWMEKNSRVTLPDKIVWHQSNRTHQRFYWLASPSPKSGQDITARREGQTVTLASMNVPTVTVLLNDAMLNLDQPVTIHAGEVNLFSGRVPRTIATLARTLAERGDTNLTFSAEVTVRLP